MGVRNDPGPAAVRFGITIEDDRRVWISGCVALLVYEEAKIVIRVRGQFITVNGNGLSFESYEGRELCISGKIDSVSLEKRV